MRRLTTLTIALICLCELAVGQKNIIIQGVTENAKGRKVELLMTADAISQAEMLLDTFRIGEDGKFKVGCWARYPIMVTMRIDNYSQSFYVEPGKDYSVVIPTFDWSIDERRNINVDPEPLPLIFQNIPSNDINLQIDSIDRVISRYIRENFFYFDHKFHPSANYFDSLTLKVARFFPDSSSDFVTRYRVYKLAELEYDMKFTSRKALINKFIKGKPVLYYDENYMSLFATLFANSISKGTRDIPVQRLSHWVSNLDVDTYLDSIGMDPLLRNEQIRELAALQALRESYYNYHYYDASMVIKMIEKIAGRTKFAEHKTIAQHILDGLGEKEESFQDVVFTLPNVDKEPVTLNDMKGKWIYIAFVRVNEPASQLEIETMAHFKDTIYSLNDSVRFVTIDCDREFQKMFHFLKNTRHGSRYNWTWLHFDGNYDMLRHFKVSTYPWFVLVNPNGELVYDITPAPSTGFLMNAPWMPKRIIESHGHEQYKR